MNQQQSAMPPPSIIPMATAREPNQHGRTDIDSISVRSFASGVSGYQYQRQYARKLRRPRTNIVTGKHTSQDTDTDTAGFRGAPEPDRHLFIFRVENSTSESDIRCYLTKRHITFKTVQCLSNPNAKYKSFKLTVGVSHFSSLFSDDLLPYGVKVRPFKAPNNHDNLNTNNYE